jgi:hypothetical protein
MISIEGLNGRVARLEHHNRNLRLAIYSIVIVFVAMFTMAQTKSGAIIEGERLVLRDSNGRIYAEFRPTTAAYGGGELVFFRNNASRSLRIDNLGTLIYRDDGASVHASYFLDGVSLHSSPDSSSSLSLFAVPKGASLLLKTNNNEAFVFTAQDAVGVSVNDAAGYRTELGNTEVVTSRGETRRTSAASMTFFDREKKVIATVP